MTLEAMMQRMIWSMATGSNLKDSRKGLSGKMDTSATTVEDVRGSVGEARVANALPLRDTLLAMLSWTRGFACRRGALSRDMCSAFVHERAHVLARWARAFRCAP